MVNLFKLEYYILCVMMRVFINDMEIESMSVEPFVSVEDAPTHGSKHDPVNHPSHYASGGIECIEAIKASMSREAFLGYLKGNVQKYVFRYEKKVAPWEDLKKARWYLERLIKEIENDQIE
jgi:hypothetical protein